MALIDFEWTSKFGNVVRYKAPFGEDRLLVSDLKAVQHILQGYRWGQPTESRASTFFVAGPSILYVQGEDHKRHRRIMNPVFGAPEAKALVPVFSEAASGLTNKWKDLLSLSQDEAEGQVFDMTKWVSRTMLDAIGHAGFDYNFGAMQNQDNQLANVYHNLFADMFAAPSDKALIRGHLTSFIPIGVMSRLLEYLSKSDPRLARGRESREVAREVASELVREKSKVVAESGSSKRGKDVTSLLVKANMAFQSEKNRLSDEELYVQMLVMFIAGHETTANSLSWSLLELARPPQVQVRLQKEIHDKERQIAWAEGRSGSGFTAADLDSLPYMNAVLKVRINAKMAYADDCLPLSVGIKTTGGKGINEIPVRKGQKVLISIAA
ncbi:hypothetical protein PQX77_015423 [Marasmius sp. AFHP31]|nr:hypothetical protein PQX77_015423 [Marasmius sp. AFHP31]